MAVTNTRKKVITDETAGRTVTAKTTGKTQRTADRNRTGRKPASNRTMQRGTGQIPTNQNRTGRSTGTGTGMTGYGNTAGRTGGGGISSPSNSVSRPGSRQNVRRDKAPSEKESSRDVSLMEAEESGDNAKKRKKSDRFRRIVTIVSGLIGAACLGYFAFYCISAANARKQAESLAELKDVTLPSVRKKPATVTLDLVEEPPEILEEYQTLYVKNKSLAGWIRIPGTEIDYPVMQTRNNDYYLNHDFEQKEDKNGSIFIDCDCSIWPRSENLLIYGHNMMSGKMFGTLDNYKSEDYFKKHPAIQFDTLYEKGTYQIMYVFSEVVHEASEVTFKYYQFIDANSEEEYDSNMRYMSEMSLYDTGVTSSFGDDLITLSTCDYEEGSERFAVVAKKID